MCIRDRLITGCSGRAGGQEKPDDYGGTYKLRIIWPDKLPESRVIPSQTASISVTVTGFGLSSPVLTSVSRAGTASSVSIVIQNLPAGHKVALIKALDAYSNLLAQRKDSFVIYNAGTQDSGNVPLGVVITGNETNPVFEPSDIYVPMNSEVYFQNWISGADITVLSPAGNMTLSGAAQDITEKWIYSDDSKIFTRDATITIQGKTSLCNLIAEIGHYTFVTKWGSSGTSNSQFSWAYLAGVDKDGNIGVCDISTNNRIQEFTPTGAFRRKLGGPPAGTGNGQFNYPIGLAYDSFSNVYVSDYHCHRIQKFNSNFNFLTKYGRNHGDGTYGTDNGEFYYPTGITIDSQGNIYVSEFYNHRVQKFTSDWVFVTKWGKNNGMGGQTSTGSDNGEFNYPIGLAADRFNCIYVADTNNHRIQKFTSNGNFLLKIGKNGVGGRGSGNMEFNTPCGISCDLSGRLYVAEVGNNRIQKFTPSGVFMLKMGRNNGDGSSGSENGEFNSPRAVVVDADWNVYVVEQSNYRVQKLAPAP